MNQLELFHGDHVPLTAARRALAGGDVAGAGAQLSARPPDSAEAADGERLRAIAHALTGSGAVSDPEGVHDVFASVLARHAGPGCLAGSEWFAIYARALARALAAAPERRMRGWLGVHFAWAAGDAREALALAQARAAQGAAGADGIEIARTAFALGRAAQGQIWLREACLASCAELACDPPDLERCGVAALDVAPALPRLPDAVEQLWSHVALLELEGSRAPWIPVVGEIDGVLATPVDEPSSTPSALLAEEEVHDIPAAHAFIAALRSARRARARDGYHRPDHCSDRELRARRRMQQISPVLFARYLSVLRASLFA